MYTHTRTRIAAGAQRKEIVRAQLDIQRVCRAGEAATVLAVPHAANCVRVCMGVIYGQGIFQLALVSGASIAGAAHAWQFSIAAHTISAEIKWHCGAIGRQRRVQQTIANAIAVRPETD